MARSNEQYKTSYGSSAMRPGGVKPDYARCCEEVTRYIGNWPTSGQCARKRGHGPGEAYCKQHVPEAVKARTKAAYDKDTADWNKRRYEMHGRTFYAALKSIAEGRNDAREHATEVLAKFHEGERK